MHERQMRRTLAVLLTNPFAPEAMRQAVDASSFDHRIFAQAMLPARRSPRHVQADPSPVQAGRD